MSKKDGLLSDFIGAGDETRAHANSIFARWGSDDNFFSGGASIWSKIRPTRGGKRGGRSQAAVIPGYADGRDKGGIPAIAGSGRRSRRDRTRVPQIAGTAARARGQSVPAISGAGSPNATAPQIGSGSVETRSSRDRSAPVLGGYVVAEGNSPGVNGKRFHRARRSIAAQMGFRSLSKAEEEDMDLFLRRAHQAGHEVPYRQWMSWRASIMLDEITVMDLWNGPIGQDIQRRYGERGQALDVPESKRTAGQVVPEPEETKVNGVAQSTRPEGAEVVR